MRTAYQECVVISYGSFTFAFLDLACIPQLRQNPPYVSPLSRLLHSNQSLDSRQTTSRLQNLNRAFKRAQDYQNRTIIKEDMAIQGPNINDLEGRRKVFTREVLKFVLQDDPSARKGTQDGTIFYWLNKSTRPYCTSILFQKEIFLRLICFH